MDVPALPSRAAEWYPEAMSKLVSLALSGAIAFGLYQYFEGESAPPENPDETHAWTMAKELVRRSLKSPSTASFGSFLGGEKQDPKTACTLVATREWRCAGWVDSQNGFGATVRTQFEATVTNPRGSTKWELKALEFDGVKQ